MCSMVAALLVARIVTVEQVLLWGQWQKEKRAGGGLLAQDHLSRL
jgi:hypothetical protein